MVSSHCFLIPDYPFWALLLRWVLMIRISNSSTVNFDKNSLSTVYWIGSFFSKLYRPPCYSYLFSTYAKGLIQYAYSLFFSEAIRWLLDKLHWNLTIPILMGEPHHASVSLFWYTGHGSNFSNRRLRITGVVARFFIPPFHGSWRSSPSAHRISNVSDYFIQFSKNTCKTELEWGGITLRIYSLISLWLQNLELL